MPDDKPPLSFRNWSKQAGKKPFIWPTSPKLPPATIKILISPPPTFHQHVINIAVGEPQANVGLDYADIQFPEPFDALGNLTDACQSFIINVVRKAVNDDHKLRWLIWADHTLTSCNPINGRR